MMLNYILFQFAFYQRILYHIISFHFKPGHITVIIVHKILTNISRMNRYFISYNRHIVYDIYRYYVFKILFMIYIYILYCIVYVIYYMYICNIHKPLFPWSLRRFRSINMAQVCMKSSPAMGRRGLTWPGWDWQI